MSKLIISDVHIGHQASKIQHAGQLLPLIDGFDQVVFNGDTFEQRFKKEQARFPYLMEGLSGILQGKTHTFICGNHDPYISDNSSIAFPEGVVVCHGDIVCPKTLKCAVSSRKVREEQLERSCNKKGNATRLRYFLSNTLPPHKVVSTLKLWKSFHSTTEPLTVLGNNTKFVVTGHFHKAGISKHSTHISINTGSFMLFSKPLAVVVNNGEIGVYTLVFKQGMVYLGNCISRFHNVS
jgi:UDP-2,3-diacylglucosamine pyrophosphatase LpxH